MSRCFPYPPPGFEKSLALIESIKLQKEREKAKKERKKEKKREKEEKKEKSLGHKEKTEAEKLSHRKRHYEELRQSTHKTRDFRKAREDESEQLEKSSLTEEQGGPSAVQSVYDSSDSTHNSSKRSRHESAGVSRATHGNGLRIRLPLSRHKDTEKTAASELPCFSGRTETVPAQPGPKAGRTVTVPAQQGPKAGRTVTVPTQQGPKAGRTLTVPAQQEPKAGRTVTVLAQQEPKATVHLHPPSPAEQPCFSGRSGTNPFEELHENAGGNPASVEVGRVQSSGSSSSSHDRDVRRLYKKLILEWNPPPLQVENPEADDQDWLFGETSRRRHHGQGETKKDQAVSEDAGLGSALCSWPPRACLLPEVGIYALPYVVPF